MGDFSAVPRVYQELQKRLDQFPVGAPEAPELYEILQILFTAEEAHVASRMPMSRAPLDEVARAVGMDEASLGAILDTMADKGLVMDLEKGGQRTYALQPTLTGFFEFVFQKPRPEWPMERLAWLTHRYFYEGGHAQEFLRMKSPRIRTVTLDRSLGPKPTGIKPYEEVVEIVKASGGGAILKCYCRNKAVLRGEPCEHPIEICLSLGRGGEFLASRGMGRKASVEELLAKVAEAEELGLVHAVDNFRENQSFLCNCCSCHCEFLTWIKRRIPGAMQPSNFLPAVDPELCVGCGLCEQRCPVSVIAMSDEPEPRPRIDGAWCLGCGVCTTRCPTGAITLQRRTEFVEPPKDMRTLWNLIREGKEAGAAKV